MSKIIVSNWKEVWKSYAVLLPAVALSIHTILEAYLGSTLVPEAYLPVLVVVSSGLGWVIKQSNIKKGVAYDSSISRTQ